MTHCGRADRCEIEDRINLAQTKISSEIEDRISMAKSEIGAKMEEQIKEFEQKLAEKTTAPWAKLYNMDITDELLVGNIGHHEHFISLIKDYANKSAEGTVPKLLEVGLGTATMSIYFSRYSYDVAGIDLDPVIISKAIETNKKLGGYAKFILMDAFDLDLFKEKYFDVAFSQGTMEHFKNDHIIKLISKQLKVAKYVIFSVPSGNYPHKEYGNERKMFIEDWELLLQNAGFKVIYIDYYQDNWHIACVIDGMNG